MKRLVSLLLAVCMCCCASLVMAACGEEHTHTYKSEWVKDATHHWHECEDEACLEVSEKAEHTWDDGVIIREPTAEESGEKLYTCTVCKATRGMTLASTGMNNEKWQQIVKPAIFENVTFGYTATFVAGYNDVGPHIGTLKLSMDKVVMDGELVSDPETIASIKTMYTDTVLAMVENFEVFECIEPNKYYSSIENIVYSVTIMGYEATITAESVVVELDGDMNISRITCVMIQVFDDDGVPTTYTLDAEFTFTDYGTTDVE